MGKLIVNSRKILSFGNRYYIQYMAKNRSLCKLQPKPLKENKTLLKLKIRQNSI